MGAFAFLQDKARRSKPFFAKKGGRKARPVTASRAIFQQDELSLIERFASLAVTDKSKIDANCGRKKAADRRNDGGHSCSRGTDKGRRVETRIALGKREGTDKSESQRKKKLLKLVHFKNLQNFHIVTLAHFSTKRQAAAV